MSIKLQAGFMEHRYTCEHLLLYDIHTIIVIRLMTMISSSSKKSFLKYFFLVDLYLREGADKRRVSHFEIIFGPPTRSLIVAKREDDQQFLICGEYS